MFKLLGIVLALSFSLAAAPVMAQAQTHRTAPAKSKPSITKSKPAAVKAKPAPAKGKRKPAPTKAKQASPKPAKAKAKRATAPASKKGINARKAARQKPVAPPMALVPTITRPGDVLWPNPRD